MNQTPKQNEQKINKLLYIVTVTMLLAIAVIIAITTAANKKLDSQVPSRTENETESILPADTDEPKASEKNPPETQITQENIKQNDAESALETENVPAEPADLPPAELSLPTVGILSKKHDETQQVYSQTMNDYRTHTGIDIVSEAGAPVYAAADGTVSQIWNDPLMGKCIALSHGGDCYTVYKNLAEEIAAGIEEGTKVVSGQLIASVGESAMIEIAEEPHLHFEVTIGDKSLDPLDFFSESALVSISVDSSFES